MQDFNQALIDTPIATNIDDHGLELELETTHDHLQTPQKLKHSIVVCVYLLFFCYFFVALCNICC